MAQVSIVNLSETENRLDSEYYKPFNLKAEYLVTKNSHKKLKNFGDFIVGPFGSTVKVEDYNLKGEAKYIRGKDVKNGFISDMDNAKILKEKYDALPHYHLVNKDVLITVVGTLGNIAIYDKSFGPAIFSCKSTAFRTTKINPEFIAVFLLTKYGNALLMRNERGAIQKGFNLPDLKNIPVPIFNDTFRKKVADLFDESGSKKGLAKKNYNEAKQILLEALSLKDYKPKHEISFDANLNEILGSKRIDAEYYQPKYKIVEERIRKVKHDTLGRLFDFVKGFEVGGEAYREKGIPYLRVSNLEVLELDWSNPKFISEELFNQLKGDYQPQKGEILLSKDGTLGIAHLVRDNIKSVHSSGILRLKLKDTKKLNLSYMTLVLNSILIQQQIDRDSGGAIIKHWRPDEVKNTLVPILDDDIQEQIALKLDESYRLRKESKELLEKAKKMVEDEIEKEAK